MGTSQFCFLMHCKSFLLSACSIMFTCIIHMVLCSTFAERLALIRQQRADAAKKRDEEKNGIQYLLLESCSSNQFWQCDF